MLASSLQTKMQEMVLDMAEITKAHILKSTLYRVFAQQMYSALTFGEFALTTMAQILSSTICSG